MKITACRSCQARVVWVMTTKGKRMPLDADPVPDGNIIIIGSTLHGVPLVSVALNHDGLPPGTDTSYQSHFASCPDAPSWRRDRDRR